MRIICCVYKDFVRQLNAFLPSFCHLCACEMSPGWGHLITWMDPSMGHLNGILARVGGNLNNNFRKSQMSGGVPGGYVEASIWPIHTLQCGKKFLWVLICAIFAVFSAIRRNKFPQIKITANSFPAKIYSRVRNRVCSITSCLFHSETTKWWFIAW